MGIIANAAASALSFLDFDDDFLLPFPLPLMPVPVPVPDDDDPLLYPLLDDDDDVDATPGVDGGGGVNKDKNWRTDDGGATADVIVTGRDIRLPAIYIIIIGLMSERRLSKIMPEN
jgi:hypothetical protein